MDQPLALVRPTIGIVTVIGNDHLTSFASAEDIVAETAKLVASLPPGGTAVLNADDEHVSAMSKNCEANVITYGTSPDAKLRAEDISAIWPDRLEFSVSWGADEARVRTQLCGAHLLSSVLGAIGGGLATGMTLKECAEGIAGAVPVDGRKQPVESTDGVTFIRDDFKAPLWSLDTCFDFMRTARAKRKIFVIGELSDVGSEKGNRYAKVASLAQGIADVTVFVGPWASSALKARKQADEDSLRAFSHVREAAAYVNSITRSGDLVLLKGSNKQNLLLRIVLARSETISCWRDDCGRNSFCYECPHKARPAGNHAAVPVPDKADSTARLVHESLPAVAPDEHVVVGLGNPEPSYSGSPHNVGHAVVDRISVSLGLEWFETDEAWIARSSTAGRRTHLVKIKMAMNHSGIGLKQLAERLSFKPEQCILVFDDIDLPIGTVRLRTTGGAGGHRGVASILEAFQTDAFRRIKVGVGKQGAKLNRIEYLLEPFDTADRAVVDQAMLEAEARVLGLVSQQK